MPLLLDVIVVVDIAPVGRLNSCVHVVWLRFDGSTGRQERIMMQILSWVVEIWQKYSMDKIQAKLRRCLGRWNR